MIEEYYNWKTTPGVGDFMMGLNVAYARYGRKRRPITINFHWYHEPDHYHHCEDPETIIERFNYIHNFYYKKDAVKVQHTFNSTNPLNDRWEGFKNGVPRGMDDLRTKWYENAWSFDPKMSLPTDDNKVVIWRPMMNAEVPRLWKRRVTDDEWQIIIDSLEDLGYNVVELEYKTPISEATYHINTCSFTLSYDGMWHYIARNFYKPMIVLSNDAITHFHTRHALRVSTNKTLSYCMNLNSQAWIDKKLISPLDKIFQKAAAAQKQFWEWESNENR